MFYKIIFLVVIIFNNFLYGYIFQWDKNLKTKRLRISSTLGISFGGPSKDIEKQLIYYGFNDTTPKSFFGGPTEHPFTTDNIFVDFTLSVVFNKKYALGLYYFKSYFSTVGYQIFPKDTFFFIDYNFNSFALLSIFNPLNFIQFGVGIGIAKLQITKDEMYNSSYSEYKLRPEILVQASLYLPRKSRFFLKITGNVGLLLKEKFGPIILYRYYDFNVGILKAFNVKTSFAFLGLGCGLFF